MAKKNLTRIYCNEKLKREIEITKAEAGHKSLDETTEEIAEVIKKWRKEGNLKKREYGRIRF